MNPKFKEYMETTRASKLLVNIVYFNKFHGFTYVSRLVYKIQAEFLESTLILSLAVLLT